MRYTEKELQRFMSKVAQPAHGSACWQWTAFRDKEKGYGKFRLHGKWAHAHRASWLMFIGDIPHGMHVLHRCDNRMCVNFDHLFIGTHADNMTDRTAKGRHSLAAAQAALLANPKLRPRGERMAASKLKDSDVREILSLTGVQTMTKTAAKFNVSRKLVWLVQRRLSWKHITLEGIE